MMSQADKRQETEISLPPSTNEDKVLSRLNQNYRLSKAQQILRLLKDQDDLNQRFRHCALLEDEDDGSKRRQDDDDEVAWSVHEGNRSEDEDDSDTSENEADRRAAPRVALRKHRNSIDPGRCKTSMGFYNEAEVTEIPYDTDSDNVTGLDSACFIPRGVTSGALSARHSSNHKVYGAMGTGARATHIGAALGNSGSSSSNNSRLRVYHLNMGESDVNVRELSLPEDCVIQSARSSRPKTSMVSTSARSRNYRQQPHSESKPTKKAQNNHHNHSHNHGHGHTQNHSHTRNHSHNKNNNSHLMHHNHQS
ncbi:non-canonical poly(A) RNA polymerase protein Trf4-1-like [Littorina saxatilis]|uniref:non-canonical poly(A) RNA polymerase protein Trf4-1-like n=1 Tax=Littorina saxatilis TaxID=31220 RepID=UPI0038B43B76